MLLVALLAAFTLPAVSASSANTSSAAVSSQVVVANADVVVTAVPSATRVRPGDTFYISFKINNRSSYPISDLAFDITFDNTKVTCNGPAFSAESNYASNELGFNRESGVQNKYRFILNVDEASKCFARKSESTSILTLMFSYPTAASSDTLTSFTLSNFEASCKASCSPTMLRNTFDSDEIAGVSANVTLASLSADNTFTELSIIAKNKASGEYEDLPMTPTFTPATTTYKVYYDSQHTDLRVEYRLSDADRAKMELSKPDGGLAVGDNTLTLTVTAENGSKKVYTVIITRLAEGVNVSSYLAAQNSSSAPSSSQVSSMVSSQVSSIVSSDVSSLVSSEISSAAPSSSLPSSSSQPESVEDITVSELPPQESSNSGIFPYVNINLGVVLGIILGEIALFAGAFAAGYMTHKNIVREQLFEEEEDEYDDYDEDEYDDYE